MLMLKLPRDKAKNMLSLVEHHTFQRGLDRYWHVDDTGKVQAQSVLWLFCWGKNGNA